jgi:hypothetical protein
LSRATLFIARIETRYDRGSGLDTPEKHRLLDRRTAWNGNCQMVRKINPYLVNWTLNTLKNADFFVNYLFAAPTLVGRPRPVRAAFNSAWKQRVWMAGSESIESAVRLGHDTPRG